MSPEDRLRGLRDPDRWVGLESVPAPAGSRPRRGWVPVVAAFAIALAVAAGLFAGLSRLRTVPASPSPTTSLRAADCTTALDPTTRDALRALGYVPSGPEFTAKAAGDPASAAGRFLPDGTACRWSASDDAAVVYAWGPLADATSERARIERDGAVRVPTASYERWTTADGSAGGWAFGDGWWAYASGPGGGFDVLDQVVRNTTGLPIPPTCRPADVEVPATAMGGATGTDYGDLVLTNTGAEDCTLGGFPSAHLVATEGGARVGAVTQQELWNGSGDRPDLAPVTLEADGGHAYVRVSIVNAADYGDDSGACGGKVEGRGWELTLPGTVDPLFVPFTAGTIPLCSDPDLATSDLSQVLAAPTVRR